MMVQLCLHVELVERRRGQNMQKNCTASELDGFSEWLIFAFLLRLFAAAQVLHAPHCAPSVIINLLGNINEKVLGTKDLHLHNLAVKNNLRMEIERSDNFFKL